MVRILQILTSLDGNGGVQKFLLNYYSNMDRDKIHCDFIVLTEEVGEIEQIFLDWGSKVFHIQGRKENTLEYYKKMNKIMAEGNYDIVHCHQEYLGAIPLYLAKKNNIKVRISHGHLAYVPRSPRQKIIKFISTIILKHCATNLFACSNDAAKWLYGEKTFKQGNVTIINNAIKTEDFSFDNELRGRKRKELGLEDKFIVGNISRFIYQKNHEFLIEIFSQIYQKNKDAVLLLIGDGELKEEVKKQINDLKINEAVKFLGIRDDVNELLQAMDVFLFPTRFEGLGIVLIEAQVSGLKCITSKGLVPIETKVTDEIMYIPLTESKEYWAEQTLKNSNYVRKDLTELVKESGFDIQVEAGKLEKLYLELKE